MLFLKKLLMSFSAVMFISLSVHSMEEYSSDLDADEITSLGGEYLPHSMPVPIVHITLPEWDDSYDTFLAKGGCGGGGTPPQKYTFDLGSSLSEDSFSPYQNYMNYSSLLISDSPLFEIEKFEFSTLYLKNAFKPTLFPILVIKKEKEVVDNCFPQICDDIWKHIFIENSFQDMLEIGGTCLRFAVLTERAKYVFKNEYDGSPNLEFSNYCFCLENSQIQNLYLPLSDNEQISIEEIEDAGKEDETL